MSIQYSGKDMLLPTTKWHHEFRTKYCSIHYVTQDEKNGGIVCTMRRDDFGNFEQLPLFMKSRETLQLLIEAYNENKLSHDLMRRITENLNREL